MVHEEGDPELRQDPKEQWGSEKEPYVPTGVLPRAVPIDVLLLAEASI